MDSSSSVIRRFALSPARVPFYYGWVNLAVAALAMVGTLPGRTQGLGLIAEPLMRDLQIDRVFFGQINFWATLIGSLFCMGVGRLVDRAGSRTVLTAISLMLGTVVLLMSGVKGVLFVGLLITLTRGLGQSALSVVSLTMVGHWFVRRINLAMAVYTILLSVGFMVAFLVVGAAVIGSGWRVAWAGVGGALLLVLGPAAWLLVRRAPERADIAPDDRGRAEVAPDDTRVGFTLRQALSTTRFWVFALSSSIYGLIASGIALFNESVLAERGFDASTYHRSLAITAITALLGNFLGGWLTARWSMKRLMALAMWLLAASLLGLPRVTTQAHVVAYAIVMGLAGGFVIVIFFSFWSRSFGRAHLGKIQGAAQTLTVLASAIGPLLMAWGVERTGSYAAGFYLLAVVVVALGISAWFVSVPPDLRLETS
ncbi:MAG TPA: MFS transporter [Blastocatellia bacterium]|nr:MFS transporter [Blastocatellia bacterium]